VKKTLISFIIFLFFLANSIFAEQKTSDSVTSFSNDIAIVDFKNISGDSLLNQYCKSLPDIISTRLATSQKLSLVERGQMSSLIDEAELASSDIANPETAVRIGKLVSAKAVFIGTISLFKAGSDPNQGLVVLNTRLVNVENGRIIDGWSITCRESEIKNKIEKVSDDILIRLYPLSPLSAAWRSAVLPGWGQFANNQKTGWFFAGLTAISVGFLIYEQVTYSKSYTDYCAATKITKIEQLKPTVDLDRALRNTSIGVLAGVWAGDIIEAYIESLLLTKAQEKKAMRIGSLPFDPFPTVMVGNGWIGLSFNVFP
jgi:TolB-like protein